MIGITTKFEMKIVPRVIKATGQKMIERMIVNIIRSPIRGSSISLMETQLKYLFKTSNVINEIIAPRGYNKTIRNSEEIIF